MISLLSLITLQAHALTFDVNAAQTLESQLLSACTAPNGPHVIRIRVDNGASQIAIGPGSIQGDLGVYPPNNAACLTGAALPDISIVGFSNSDANAVATIKFNAQGTTNATLLSFGGGADVTLSNLRLVGMLASEVPNDIGDPEAPSTPRCALFGDHVRGVSHVAGPANNLGSLTTQNVEFNCLDGDSLELGVGSRLGGAISAEGVPVVVRDSIFIDNFAFEGGAIALTPGAFTLGAPSNPSLVIERSDFRGNYATFGGAISVLIPNHAVQITDSVFDNNLGTSEAGGVNFEDVGEVTIERTVFDRQNPVNFEANQKGGAVRIVGADGLNFRNNIVCGSWAGEGGGVYALDPGPVDVEASVFSENGGLCYGGGLYIEGSDGDDVRVVNNTFVGNEAGRSPPYLNDPVLCSIGGGGAAAFSGVNPEFRNNVIAFQAFGGGVFGHYIPFTTAPGYQIGDELIFFNNLWWDNEDGVSEGHVTGDFASIAFHPSNLFADDPDLVYLGPGEYNCEPEAFYPRRTSAALDAGGGDVVEGIPGDCQDWVDTSATPDFVHDQPLAGDGNCDIGAFGGRYGLFAKDTDGDGWSNIFDCNDADAGVNPGQPDECDFIDNDCNGIVDDGLAVQWWPDADGDGKGNTDLPQELSCVAIPGKVSNDFDCDDGDNQKFVGAPEVCNDEDDDCDDLIDEELTLNQYFPDLDGDGFGADVAVQQACQSPGVDFITTGGDCDDGNPAVQPGAPETCGDGVDNNCNGVLDPEDETTIDAASYYPDVDGDDYGDIDAEPIRLCGSADLEGFATNNEDCNDADAEISPEAPEICAEPGDEDCDGALDEVDRDTLDALVAYTDADGDGFGSEINPAYYCPTDGAPPAGTVDVGGDCNDLDALVGECSECGCQATPAPLQGALGLVLGMAGVLIRRRR